MAGAAGVYTTPVQVVAMVNVPGTPPTPPPPPDPVPLDKPTLEAGTVAPGLGALIHILNFTKNAASYVGTATPTTGDPLEGVWKPGENSISFAPIVSDMTYTVVVTAKGDGVKWLDSPASDPLKVTVPPEEGGEPKADA